MREFEYLNIGKAQIVLDEIAAHLHGSAHVRWTNRPEDPAAHVTTMEIAAYTRPVADYFGDKTPRTHFDVAIDTLTTEKFFVELERTPPSYLFRHRRTGIPVAFRVFRP